MKKLLLAILLTIFSASVTAEWSNIRSNKDYDLYVDVETTKFNGYKISIWTMLDYFQPNVSKKGSYQSSVDLWVFDCVSETASLQAVTHYSKRKQNGNVIFSKRREHEKFEPIVPNTAIEEVFKLVCQKK